MRFNMREWIALTALLLLPVGLQAQKPRERDLKLPIGGAPGTLDAITDVAGVEVGHTTLISGTGKLVVGSGPVRTGVTVIHPRGKANSDPVFAAWFTLNGNGEMTGTTWIEESGALASPIMITNTHAVGAVHDGVLRWLIANHPQTADQWVLPVVAETWDGYLNNLNAMHVSAAHAGSALSAAASGPIEEGSVGGGTGMICYNFKGGSGTSSRTVPYGDERYTVAAFVQANFGARHELTVAGVPVGLALPYEPPASSPPLPTVSPLPSPLPPAGSGSVIVILATDAPLLPGQCKALARRATMGIARTGTSSSHFSGDIFLAFSTANVGALASRFPSDAGSAAYDSLRFVPWGLIDPFYEAAVWSVEEAVLNALVANQDMVGYQGLLVPALPHSALKR
jgi:D-aminopeptidase